MIAPEKDFRVALRAKEAPVQGAFFLAQIIVKTLLIGDNAVHDNKDYRAKGLLLSHLRGKIPRILWP